MSANPGALPGWFDRREVHGQSDAASQPDEKSADGATVAHTTTGGGKDDQPVVVWEAANRMEAEIVAGRLRSEDIPAIIRGESLGAIYGLTTGSLAAANVLVPAALADKALAILTSTVEWDNEAEFNEGAPTDIAPDPDHDG
jgi:uncharacterized protein YbbC (DUF1343 family)